MWHFFVYQLKFVLTPVLITAFGLLAASLGAQCGDTAVKGWLIHTALVIALWSINAVMWSPNAIAGKNFDWLQKWMLDFGSIAGGISFGLLLGHYLRSPQGSDLPYQVDWMFGSSLALSAYMCVDSILIRLEVFSVFERDKPQSEKAPEPTIV